jgi:hypothetical protein
MMQPGLSLTRGERNLLDKNRRFYDMLWSGASLVEPQRFNNCCPGPLAGSKLRPA